MILASHGIIGSQITQFVGLLDDYSGAAAAYSLRKLRGGYTGSAIGVRIDTTGQPEYNIGFVDGELDVATLEGYCTGGLNAFVKTWYDQSGNGNDASQVTAASQPQIVNSGSVILEGGKPSVQFDGSNSYMTSSGFGQVSARSTFMTFAGNGNGSGYENYWIFVEALPSTLGNFMQLYSPDYNSNIVLNYPTASLDITSTTAPNVQQILSTLHNSSSSALYQNGSNTGSGTGTQTLEGTLSIGNYSTNYAFAKYQEFIIYNSDQTSNRTGIETNINDFYSIY